MEILSALIIQFLLNSCDNSVFSINYFYVKQLILD